MTGGLISVILPVHNQADHIEEIVEDFVRAISQIQNPHEILLVVNNCRDDSLSVCQKLAGKYSGVRVIESKAGGWGLAVKLGLAEARGDIIAYTNSARTSAEQLAVVLFYAVVNSDTVIKANRKIRDNLSRRLGSLLYNLECRMLFDLPTWDINGTPKVFPRKFSKLLELKCSDDLIDAEFNAVCRKEEYPLLEVPILSTKRHGGQSTTNLRSAFRMYWGAFKLWQRFHRPA